MGESRRWRRSCRGKRVHKSNYTVSQGGVRTVKAESQDKGGRLEKKGDEGKLKLKIPLLSPTVYPFAERRQVKVRTISRYSKQLSLKAF